MTDIDFGTLTPLMQDPEIMRITVQNPASIQVWHGKEGLQNTDIHFADDDEVLSLAKNIATSVSMPFDYQHPIVDVHLPNGVRALLISRHVSSGGTVIHIEKAYDDEMTLEKMVNVGAISQVAVDFLLACVRGHRKIAVVGSYHSARKTVLNAIARHIPAIAPTVILQPFNAIHLPEHVNVVKLESQQAAFMNGNHLNNKALLDAGLRLKPHRLIIAELDGTETGSLLNAMQNSLDTFFAMTAVNPSDAVAHLEMMATTSNFSRPVMAIREQIADSLDMIVHVDLMTDGFQRIISIVTIEGMQGDSISIVPIFERENGLVGGNFLPTGNIPVRTIQRLKAHGIGVDKSLFQT